MSDKPRNCPFCHTPPKAEKSFYTAFTKNIYFCENKKCRLGQKHIGFFLEEWQGISPPLSLPDSFTKNKSCENCDELDSKTSKCFRYEIVLSMVELSDYSCDDWKVKNEN